MKKVALLISIFLLLQQNIFAETTVYSKNNHFGLKESNNTITEAKYKKLVRLGETSWILQDGTKFGIINDKGEMLIPPIYNQAERVLGKYVKFRKGDKYGIYDEYGVELIEPVYSSIDQIGRAHV